jgi:hypothetical protein
MVSTTPRPLYPRERPGTHCTGRLGGPQGQSGRVRKISPPPGFDPRTVQPEPVAIPTELPGPRHYSGGPNIISSSVPPSICGRADLQNCWRFVKFYILDIGIDILRLMSTNKAVF